MYIYTLYIYIVLYSVVSSYMGNVILLADCRVHYQCWKCVVVISGADSGALIIGRASHRRPSWLIQHMVIQGIKNR